MKFTFMETNTQLQNKVYCISIELYKLQYIIVEFVYARSKRKLKEKK